MATLANPGRQNGRFVPLEVDYRLTTSLSSRIPHFRFFTIRLTLGPGGSAATLAF